MRSVVLLVLLLPAACDKAPGAKGGAPGGAARAASETPPVLATTGSPRVREARESLLEDIEEMERSLAQGRLPERRLVEGARKLLENLVATTRRSIELEARDTVRGDHAALMSRQADLEKRRADLYEGIREIDTYLDEIGRGVGRPPAGFTEDELKDKRGELQEQARVLDKEEAELRARMKEKEDLLGLEKVPPQGETVFTHELQALEKLRGRLEAIEARVK